MNPSFQGVNRPFVISFEDNASLTSYEIYFLLTVELKQHNIIKENIFHHSLYSRNYTFSRG